MNGHAFLWDLLTPCLQRHIRVKALNLKIQDCQQEIAELRQADSVARDLHLIISRVYWQRIFDIQSDIQTTSTNLRNLEKNDCDGDEDERGTGKAGVHSGRTVAKRAIAAQ